MKPAPSRQEQFQRLLREAASELGVKRSDDTAQRLAVIRMERRAIHELRRVNLESVKLSDPTRLLDTDAKLRDEEERLMAMAPRESHGPMFIIEPCRLIERERAPSPMVEVALPVGDALQVAKQSDAPADVSHNGTEASRNGTPPKSNVVPIRDKNASRDIHHGEHSALKVDATRDEFVGAFSADPAARDPKGFK